MKGRITKQISNQYTVDAKGKKYVCLPRGKFRNKGLSPLVGDIVEFDQDNKVIESIDERINELDRPVVANVDVALIVTSLRKPDVSLTLLDKEITIIKSKNIKPVICLTKIDLLEKAEYDELKPMFNYYKQIGIPVFTNKNLFRLIHFLKGKVVVLTGQTGAGKSSLLNKLDKRLSLETKPISEALNRGVHTTRHTEIYKIKKVFFVDTPGFSALDLKNVSIDNLKDAFNEFSKYNCEYADCTHDKEKNCGVKEALENGEILPSRYINYIKFLKEIYESSSKLYK